MSGDHTKYVELTITGSQWLSMTEPTQLYLTGLLVVIRQAESPEPGTDGTQPVSYISSELYHRGLAPRLGRGLNTSAALLSH